MPEDRQRKRSRSGKGGSGGQENAKRPNTRSNPDLGTPEHLIPFIPCAQLPLSDGEDDTSHGRKVRQLAQFGYEQDVAAKREAKKQASAWKRQEALSDRRKAEDEKRAHEEAATLALERAEANKLEQAKRAQEEAAEKAKRDAETAKETEEYEARHSAYLADGGDPDDWVDIP
jgi:hypothetical protein